MQKALKLLTITKVFICIFPFNFTVTQREGPHIISTFLVKKLKGESCQSHRVDKDEQEKDWRREGITQSIYSRACIQREGE